MFSIKFSIPNRIYLKSIFPIEGNNIESALIMRSIIKKLNVNVKEINECGIKITKDENENETYTWSKSIDKEIELTNQEFIYLANFLTQFNNSKIFKFNYDLLSLYSRLIYEKEIE